MTEQVTLRRTGESPADVTSILKLRSALDRAGIKWLEWGKEYGSKKLRDLIHEIAAVESTFIYDEEGKLVRKVTKAVIDVTYIDGKAIGWSYMKKYLLLRGG